MCSFQQNWLYMIKSFLKDTSQRVNCLVIWSLRYSLVPGGRSETQGFVEWMSRTPLPPSILRTPFFFFYCEKLTKLKLFKNLTEVGHCQQAGYDLIGERWQPQFSKDQNQSWEGHLSPNGGNGAPRGRVREAHGRWVGSFTMGEGPTAWHTGGGLEDRPGRLQQEAAWWAASFVWRRPRGGRKVVWLDLWRTVHWSSSKKTALPRQRSSCGISLKRLGRVQVLPIQ